MTTCPDCHRRYITAEEWDALPHGALVPGDLCRADTAPDWTCDRIAADLRAKADAELLTLARRIPPGVLAALARTDRRPVVYLAHPVGAPTVDGIHANLARARRWYWWLRQQTDWSISISWMAEVLACLEAGAVETEERVRGLANCTAQVERCDAIVLCGGRVSAGMAIERDHAIANGVRVIDLTNRGEEPDGIESLVLDGDLDINGSLAIEAAGCGRGG